MPIATHAGIFIFSASGLEKEKKNAQEELKDSVYERFQFKRRYIIIKTIATSRSDKKKAGDKRWTARQSCCSTTSNNRFSFSIPWHKAIRHFYFPLCR
jgi:hypothetical protein